MTPEEKLEQKISIRLECFSEQLSKLASDVEELKLMFVEQTKFNLELSMYYASLGAEVDAISKNMRKQKED